MSAASNGSSFTAVGRASLPAALWARAGGEIATDSSSEKNHAGARPNTGLRRVKQDRVLILDRSAVASREERPQTSPRLVRARAWKPPGGSPHRPKQGRPWPA